MAEQHGKADHGLIVTTVGTIVIAAIIIWVLSQVMAG